MPNIQQLSPTFHTSYCVNPAKLPKCQKEQGVLCKSYTTHHTWSILQCCRLQYYAGQGSSSAAALELLTDSPGNECCVVSDASAVLCWPHNIRDISFISPAITDTGACLATINQTCHMADRKLLKRPGYAMYRPSGDTWKGSSRWNTLTWWHADITPTGGVTVLAMVIHNFLFKQFALNLTFSCCSI